MTRQKPKRHAAKFNVHRSLAPEPKVIPVTDFQQALKLAGMMRLLRACNEAELDTFTKHIGNYLIEHGRHPDFQRTRHAPVCIGCYRPCPSCIRASESSAFTNPCGME